MALGIFLIGLDTVDDVLSIRAKLIAGSFTETGGLTVMSWSNENVSFTKQWVMSPKELLLECNAFLQAADSGSYGKRITRTRPAYGF